MFETGLFGQVIADKKLKKVSVYEAFVFFQDIPKTEASFYLRFQVLPLEYLNCLKSYYNIAEDFEIFVKILQMYNIKEE